MAERNTVDWIAYVLVLVGAINWGLVGLEVGNVVNMVFGSVAFLETITYLLVGLAGLWIVYRLYQETTTA